MKILFNTALLALLAVGYVSAQSTPGGCSGVRNDKPLLDLPPKTLSSVVNGQSWLMKEGDHWVYIAKLQGTAY